jgi:hypothetical protein
MEKLACGGCTDERAAQCATNFALARKAITGSLNVAELALEKTATPEHPEGDIDTVMTRHAELHSAVAGAVFGSQIELGCGLDRSEIALKMDQEG